VRTLWIGWYYAREIWHRLLTWLGLRPELVHGWAIGSIVLRHEGRDHELMAADVAPVPVDVLEHFDTDAVVKPGDVLTLRVKPMIALPMGVRPRACAWLTMPGGVQGALALQTDDALDECGRYVLRSAPSIRSGRLRRLNFARVPGPPRRLGRLLPRRS
jgi:hypothetical protein